MKKKGFAFFISLLVVSISFAQQLPGNVNLNQVSSQGGTRKDSISFEHRDDAKDSITIHYKFLDSTRSITPDNYSVNDFSTYYAVPYSLQYLGNDGSAG